MYGPIFNAAGKVKVGSAQESVAREDKNKTPNRKDPISFAEAKREQLTNIGSIIERVQCPTIRQMQLVRWKRRTYSLRPVFEGVTEALRANYYF